MHKIEHNVESAGQNERKEDAETCEIHISLRAVPKMRSGRGGTAKHENLLEFPGGHVVLRPNITGGIAF